MFANIEFFILAQMRSKEKIWLFLKENNLTYDYILKKAQVAEKTFTQGEKWIFSEMCFAELGQPEIKKMIKNTQIMIYLKIPNSCCIP